MGTTDQTLPFFTQFFQFQASYDVLQLSRSLWWQMLLIVATGYYPCLSPLSTLFVHMLQEQSSSSSFSMQ
ncbi:Hypothetical predicted protein [Olea europaea subsp. europaea]|nr:Hypothetical predicted protein [Olea europaea subsp. europaea]